MPVKNAVASNWTLATRADNRKYSRVDTTAPPAPGSPSATVSATDPASEIDLSCAAVVDPNSTIVAYNYYRSLTSGGTYAFIGALNLSTRTGTDQNLAQLTQFFYKFSAVNAFGLESALSAVDDASTTAPGDTGFNPPYPRLHAHRMSADTTVDAAQVAAIARCHTAAFGQWRRWTGSGYNIATFATYVKTFNPNIKLFAAFNIANQSNNPASVDGDIYSKLTDSIGPGSVGDWWLYNAAGSKIVGFNANFWLSNFSTFVVADAAGRKFPQWCAHYVSDPLSAGTDHITAGKGLSEGPWDGVFQDDQRIGASTGNPATDWDRDTVNDPATDTDIINAKGNGIVAFINELRALNPNWYHLGNMTNDIDTGGRPAAFKQIQEAGFFERRNFVETTQGWDVMMARYRLGLSELKSPKIGAFNCDLNKFHEKYPTSTNSDQHWSRYILCSVLQDNGYYSVNSHPPSGLGYQQPLFFEDMFGGALNTVGFLGYPTEGPVLTAKQLGVYWREFDNGIAIVNPKGNGTRTITLPSAGSGKRWDRLSGTEVNTGATNVTSYTIEAQDGIILRRVNS